MEHGQTAERLLRRLEWTVIRRLEGVLQGDYRTLFRGFGMDFADLHEYQAGDDVRWQLAELKRLGYWRARRAAITGRVVLERAHYEAVCAGERRASKVQQPQLRPA